MSHRAAGTTVAIRAATPDDRATLRELIIDGTAAAYRELPLYFLRLAFGPAPDESRAIVAVREGVVVGGVFYGLVAGAVGTGRIHFTVVAEQARRVGLGSRLCEAAVSELSERGARGVVVELPDDRDVAAGRHLLARSDFGEVARVPDYFRDGVALIVLHRAVSPSE